MSVEIFTGPESLVIFTLSLRVEWREGSVNESSVNLILKNKKRISQKSYYQTPHNQDKHKHKHDNNQKRKLNYYELRDDDEREVIKFLS